jgi:hypothetical protein
MFVVNMLYFEACGVAKCLPRAESRMLIDLQLLQRPEMKRRLSFTDGLSLLRV